MDIVITRKLNTNRIMRNMCMFPRLPRVCIWPPTLRDPSDPNRPSQLGLNLNSWAQIKPGLVICKGLQP